MKLAALYSVYNGLELLDFSIEAHKDLVDVVIIAWQEISNTGNFSPIVRNHMKRYEYDPKIKIIEWSPDLSISTKANERNKLQTRIDYARKLGCTHYYSSATDHFYRPDQFLYGVENGKEYDVTVTKMYTYYKNPEWQLAPIEEYYMPFICKIYPHTVVCAQNYPCRVDPAVSINTKDKFYEFKQDEIMMHHYSMLRDSIENKFANAAASVNWTAQDVERFVKEYKEAQIGSKISYFQGRKIIEVDNYFNIKL